MLQWRMKWAGLNAKQETASARFPFRHARNLCYDFSGRCRGRLEDNAMTNTNLCPRVRHSLPATARPNLFGVD